MLYHYFLEKSFGLCGVHTILDENVEKLVQETPSCPHDFEYHGVRNDFAHALVGHERPKL